MAKRIAWELLLQSGLLLLLYAAASLFLGVKFLAADPLASSLPFMQVAALKHILLDAALLTALLGAAVHFLIENDTPLLLWTYRAWTAFLLVTGLLGLMGLYEGRHMLELPYWLDIVQLALLVLWLLILVQGKANAGKEVFIAALIILGVAYGFSLIPIQSLLYDRILRVLMVNARYFLAYPLAAITIAYWMKPEMKLYQVSAAVVVLGSFVSIAPLTAIGALGVTGIILAPVIFLLALFITRMMMSKDNWGNLSVFMMMLSLGILGAAFAAPVLGMHMLGTQLSEVQFEIAAWSVLAMVFSLLTSLSEDNAQGFRFWLTTAGLVTAFFALTLAGVVQTFMERVLSIGYLDTQSTILPLYMIWLVGLMLFGFGILLHNLRLMRRPL